MAELSTRAKLGSLGANPGSILEVARFHFSDRDPLRRKGIRGGFDIDRMSWGSLGRPVDVTVTIESGHEGFEPDVLREVAVERVLQIERGYDEEHDDEHGLEHLVDEARLRTLRMGSGEAQRDDLVEAAALLVAAIELLDRGTLQPEGPS